MTMIMKLSDFLNVAARVNPMIFNIRSEHCYVVYISPVGVVSVVPGLAGGALTVSPGSGEQRLHARVRIHSLRHGHWSHWSHWSQWCWSQY